MPKVKYKKPKRSRPGKRVYRTKRTPYEVSKKGKNNSAAVKAGLGVLGLAVLVFIGYSIGAPIHKYITEKNSADREVMDVTVASETTFSSPFETESTEPEKTMYSDLSRIKAAEIPLSAMDDIDKIKTELSEIKVSGYNAAVFNLKDKGGKIYFNIKSPFASFSEDENIMSGLFADEIADAAKNAGLYSIAKINLLEDHSKYGDSGFGSYKSADGTLWTDENGNTFLSPYDENTIDYIADISLEIAEGGFDYILVTGDVFPKFSSSDYASLGEGLAFGDRYTALVRAANTVNKNAEVYNCGVILETTAVGLKNRTDEAVRPDELDFKNLAVIYDKDDTVSVMHKSMNIIPIFIDSAPENAENYILYRDTEAETENNDENENSDENEEE